MIVFDDDGNHGFEGSYSRRFFALGRTSDKPDRAWLVWFDPEFTEAEWKRMKNDSAKEFYYFCKISSKLPPERTGIPWRGFGKAWCTYPEVESGMGTVEPNSYEDTSIVPYQLYEHGRAFIIRGVVYVVWLDGDALESDAGFQRGRWESCLPFRTC